MVSFARFSLVLSMLALAACPDDDDDHPIDGGAVDSGTPDARVDANNADIVERLRALPHVLTVVERPTDIEGHRFFIIDFEQPADHADPDGQKFVQKLTLLYRADDAPLVLWTMGYYLPLVDFRDEVTTYLEANQLGVEHRFFLTSKPDPADWTDLTVKQSADDFHAITESFKQIFGAAWVNTGASKGGMTSVYHRRFYPDDVDATVAYVAPHSLGPDDLRYDAFLDEVVPEDCNDRLRAAQVEALKNRRAYLENRAMAAAATGGQTFETFNLPAAVEFSIAGAEFPFWQYAGVNYCADIPAVTADDSTFGEFFDAVSNPLGYADDPDFTFAPYSYQAYTELGYPGTREPHLDGLMLHLNDTFGSQFPPEVTELPPYNGATMTDVGNWVKADAEHILFIYGEFDPWTAGRFDTGTNANVASFVEKDGTHGASITNLSAADREAALALLEEWSGVTIAKPSEKPRRRSDLLPREIPPIHYLLRSNR